MYLGIRESGVETVALMAKGWEISFLKGAAYHIGC